MKKSFKRLMLLPMLAVMTMLMPTACSVNDNPAVDDNTTVIDPGDAEDFKPTVLTGADLYVAGGVDADLHQAFTWGCGTETSDPMEGEVLVLNKLTDVSEDVLKRAYEGGPNMLVCLVNPVKSEIDAYAESHDWFDIETDNVGDDLFIFGFNWDDRRYLIYQPGVVEDGDPIVENMNRAQNYYVHISAMLSNFQQNQQNGSSQKDNNGKTSMEDFANVRHYSATYRFDSHHQFRHVTASDADYLDGSGSMTALYDIFMVHVYEGEPGAGDYYGVKMTASIASGGMWKGKGWNRHGGTYVRWCGAYCKRFYVESRLVNSTNPGEDLSGKLMFTSGGYPSPSTTTGSTTYEDKNSFSLSMSQTVGGEASKGKDGSNSQSNIKGHLDLSFSESWTWEHSESRAINDVDIVNMTTNGNVAAWALNFNNLPEFKWSQDYGYDIKNNGASRGTMDLYAVWLWYDKTGKDNENRAPYRLVTYMDVVYEMQSFITTEADNKTDQWKFYPNSNQDITLPQMVNTTAGPLKIVNNMPDGTTISNIKVTTTTGIEAAEFENTVANGGEQVLGAFDTNYRYTVTFKARSRDGQTRNYKYSLNPSIKLNHKVTTTVYAGSDFTVQ